MVFVSWLRHGTAKAGLLHVRLPFVNMAVKLAHTGPCHGRTKIGGFPKSLPWYCKHLADFQLCNLHVQ